MRLRAHHLPPRCRHAGALQRVGGAGTYQAVHLCFRPCCTPLIRPLPASYVLLCAGLKYYLYSCLCLCGLVAGPTRKALRNGYKLPAEPAGLGDEVRVCVWS